MINGDNTIHPSIRQLVAPIRQVVTPRSRSKRKFVEEEEEEEEDLPQMESTSFRARNDEISFRAPKKLATEVRRLDPLDRVNC